MNAQWFELTLLLQNLKAWTANRLTVDGKLDNELHWKLMSATADSCLDNTVIVQCSPACMHMWKGISPLQSLAVIARTHTQLSSCYPIRIHVRNNTVMKYATCVKNLMFLLCNQNPAYRNAIILLEVSLHFTWFSDIGTGVCLHSIIRLEHNIIVQAYMIYNLCLQTHNKFCTSSSSLGNQFQLTQPLYM